MDRYGSDKPDRRFGAELVELTDFFAETPFRVFQADYVGAVVMPGGAGQPRKQLDAWQEFARQRGHRGLAYVLVGTDGELGGPVAKNLSETERAGVAAAAGAAPGDCIFFAAGLRSAGPEPARGHPAGDRPPAGPVRPGGLGLLLGGGRTAVRAGGGGGRGPVTSPSAPVRGPRCTTPSPRRRTWRPSTGTRARRWPGRTTWSATATRSPAARSVSTAATSRSGCSR